MKILRHFTPFFKKFFFSDKALRKTKFSELFIFASFGNVRFSKFVKTCYFWIHKNFAKKFGNKFGSSFGVKKHCFWWKNRSFWIFRNYKNFGICSIPNFPKLTKKWCKNWILKLENNSFWLNFQLEQSSSSLKCRALFSVEL